MSLELWFLTCISLTLFSAIGIKFLFVLLDFVLFEVSKFLAGAVWNRSAFMSVGSGEVHRPLSFVGGASSQLPLVLSRLSPAVLNFSFALAEKM